MLYIQTMIYNTEINSKPNGIVTPPFPPCLALSFQNGVKEIWGNMAIQPRQRLQPKGLETTAPLKGRAVTKVGDALYYSSRNFRVTQTIFCISHTVYRSYTTNNSNPRPQIAWFVLLNGSMNNMCRQQTTTTLHTCLININNWALLYFKWYECHSHIFIVRAVNLTLACHTVILRRAHNEINFTLL